MGFYGGTIFFYGKKIETDEILQYKDDDNYKIINNNIYHKNHSFYVESAISNMPTEQSVISAIKNSTGIELWMFDLDIEGYSWMFIDQSWCTLEREYTPPSPSPSSSSSPKEVQIFKLPNKEKIEPILNIKMNIEKLEKYGNFLNDYRILKFTKDIFIEKEKELKIILNYIDNNIPITGNYQETIVNHKIKLNKELYPDIF